MHSPLLTISGAQQDMRYGYFNGAPGIFASALAWLAAGLVALNGKPNHAVWALFAGGMLIFPVSVVFTKLLGRPGAHAPENPLGRLAMEGTFPMLLCLPLAYAISLYRAEWFFPAMLLVIGGRYLHFATLYGLRTYWACGGTLALSGFFLVKFNAPMAVGAFTGAAIEVVFAAIIFAGARSEKPLA